MLFPVETRLRLIACIGGKYCAVRSIACSSGSAARKTNLIYKRTNLISPLLTRGASFIAHREKGISHNAAESMFF
jgi:hypothetical protein